MSSHCLRFLSHGPVQTMAVAVPYVLRVRPNRASFRRSRTALRGRASIVGTPVGIPSGEDEIIAAAGKEASGFEPSVWRDFFINYEPKPLQACIYICNTFIYLHLSMFNYLNYDKKTDELILIQLKILLLS